MVPEALDERLRVALASSSIEQRRTLQDYVEANGLQAVDIPDIGALGVLGGAIADVLLVNLEEGDDGIDLDALIECAGIPICSTMLPPWFGT